jgi:hypothetical protein
MRGEERRGEERRGDEDDHDRDLTRGVSACVSE